MKQTITEQKIDTIIASSLSEDNVSLVEVKFDNNSKVLSISLEKSDDTKITLDECASASRKISVLLDTEDPLDGKYTLEVGSAGINRPLTKPADFKRFEGKNVKLSTIIPLGLENRKKFSGTIQQALETNFILLSNDNEEYEIDFENIKKANLDLI